MTVDYQKVIFGSFPLWETRVWNALQDLDYERASKYLEDFLSRLSDEEWEDVLWPSVVEGAPAVRGNLSEEEWEDKALPSIARAILYTSDGNRVAFIYRRVSGGGLQLVSRFHESLIRSIPATSQKDKLIWLKINKPSLYAFFLGTPAQELGIRIVPVYNPLSIERAQEYFNPLSGSIKDSLFAFATSEVVIRIASTHGLTPYQGYCLARVTGHALMGCVAPSDFTKELSLVLHSDEKVLVSVAEEIDKEILSPRAYEVAKIYVPLPTIFDDVKLTESQIQEGSQLFTGESAEILRQKLITLTPLGGEEAKEERVRITTSSRDNGVGTPRTHSLQGTGIMEEATASRVTNEPFGNMKERQESKPFVLIDKEPVLSTSVFDKDSMNKKDSSFVSFSTKPEKKSFFRNFTLPTFSFFSSKKRGGVMDSLPAQVQVPSQSVGGSLQQSGDADSPKVVHYSETRTPLTPFDDSDDEFVATNKPAHEEKNEAQS